MSSPPSSASLVVASYNQTFPGATLGKTYGDIVCRGNGIVFKYSKFQGKTRLGTEG